LEKPEIKSVGFKNKVGRGLLGTDHCCCAALDGPGLFFDDQDMESDPLITKAAREAAKQRFIDAGKSITEWADEHKFDRQAVYSVLDGRNKCLRGNGHLIALALGLKKPVSWEAGPGE